MLGAWIGFAVVPLALVAVDHRAVVGLVVMALFGVCGSVFNAAEYAMVADLLPPERREAGYASVRVANNLGVCFSPPLGDAWHRLFLGVFALAAGTFVIALRFLPRRGLYAPDRHRSEALSRSSAATIRSCSSSARRSSPA
jgi:predicted MFS family arabinose efflux permease